jgi:alpha-beta hydrolase superfamily lysophospholipase
MQYYSFPLAYQGYIILAYDARGIGESKKAGYRSDFSKRLDDFNKVLEWIQNHEDLNKLRIYALGISIGAITVLCNGFPNKKVEKIVAISSVSHYKKSLSIVNPIVKFSYFIKGVDLNPNAEIDQKFSPYFIFEKIRKNLSSEEWKIFSNRVLLIHSKNDRIIPFKNFEEIVSLLELPSENLLILKKGGHMHKKNEVALVSATIRFYDLKDYTIA